MLFNIFTFLPKKVANRITTTCINSLAYVTFCWIDASKEISGIAYWETTVGECFYVS